MSSIVPVQTYFNKRRGLAQGISMAIGGIIQFMWPVLVEYFLRTYSLSGTLVFLAGVQLQGCVFGALLRPLQRSEQKHPLNSSLVMNEAYQEPDRNLENDASVELSKRTSEVAQKRNVWKNRFSLFQNTSFWLFCLGIFLANFGYNTDVLYLPTIGVQMGNSITQSSLLVSILREYLLGITIVL